MSVISAFLAPYKAYFIGALALAVIGCVIWFAGHERTVEHTKDVAVAVKHVDTVKAEDVKIVATATTEIQNEHTLYEAVNSAPAVPDIGIVCQSPVRAPVPAPASGAAGEPAASDVVPARVFDPSGDLLTLLRSDEARIRDLQSEVATLRQAMQEANQAHK